MLSFPSFLNNMSGPFFTPNINTHISSSLHFTSTVYFVYGMMTKNLTYFIIIVFKNKTYSLRIKENARAYQVIKYTCT